MNMILHTLPFRYFQALFRSVCRVPSRLPNRGDCTDRQPPRVNLAQSMTAPRPGRGRLASRTLHVRLDSCDH